MKTKFLKISGVLALCLVTIIGIAQISNDSDDDKKKKKVEKRIEVVDDNGEKKVTVTTIEDGVEKVDIYEGKEADQYLKEHEKIHVGGENLDISIAIGGKDTISIDMDGDIDQMIKKMMTFHCDSAMVDFDIHTMMDSAFLKNKAHAFSMCKEFDSLSVNNIIKLFHCDSMGIHKKIMVIDKDVDSQSITIEDEPGDDNALEIEAFTLYPNPNNGAFKLKFNIKESEATSITVTDASGKAIYREKVRGTGVHELTLDLSEKDPGTYILNLSQGNKSTTRKIIIQ